MKNVALFSLLLIATAMVQPPVQDPVNGAWQKQNADTKEVLIFQDNYFSHTVFSPTAFISTRGGVYRYDNGKLVMNIEFDTKNKDAVGSKEEAVFTIDANGKGQWQGNWTRLDKGVGDLAGNWRITGRKQNDEMGQIRRGPRKTIKLLSGTRFQWAAINTETGEFFGTGGGTYTFKDGKYTEHIDFFSRDNSRVGASLSFDGSVKGNEWHHSGKSSQGAPIYEIWTRETE